TIGFVTCYLENGLRDESFGTDGFVFPKPESPYYNFQFYRATQGADGSIYLAGIKSNNPVYYLYVVKMDVNGNIDESFGTNGNAYVNATDVTECRQIVVTPDNEIYLLSSGHQQGDATLQTHILKLLANGEPDLSFTNGLPGSFRITIDETDENDDIDGHQLIIQPDGKLVVTGEVDGLSGNTDYFVCRVVTNSTPINIQEQEISKVEILPNPASDMLSIHSLYIIKSYEIYSLAGTTVAKQISNAKAFQLSVESLAPGLYVFQMVDEFDNRVSKTFIKK
ncbi:MAG TPA: T9SS type A sorting domain-containing protein, partial [Chitinophagales bacterium]|nr:T9SS type A sorting domain-containing protein [Chitinophagales bacterium]